MTGFVYCWTDHKENKLYIGVHKGKIDDGYICSSKIVLELMNKRPGDFTRQIIAEGDYDLMRKFETKILQSVDARKNPDFYNGHNADGSNWYLKEHTEEAKRKISKKLTGKQRLDVSLRNRTDNPGKYRIYKNGDNAGAKNPMHGKSHSVESRMKMTNNRMGIGKNIPKSEKHRQALSEAAKLRWSKRKNDANEHRI
jgi:hypothetical protein